MTKENISKIFKEALQPKAIIEDIRKNSIIYWLLLLAFTVGLFVGSQYYEMKCNMLIGDIEDQYNTHQVMFPDDMITVPFINESINDREYRNIS